MVIGYDTRFLSEAFAAQVARVLAAQGVKAFLCERDTPTPVVAHEILRRRAAGGVIITASDDPPEYNGIKFSVAWGGPGAARGRPADPGAGQSPYSPARGLPRSRRARRKRGV